MISIDDLVERFGAKEIAERTDREHYRTIDTAIAQKAIDDAVAEAMAYLNATPLVRHGVLVIAAPRALVVKVCDIARYYLYDDGAPPIVIQRYEQAIAWLKLCAKNSMMLTGNQSDAISSVAVLANPKPSIWS